MKFRKPLKITAVVLGSILLLFGLLVGAAALILTPKRLTPLVTRICEENLNARIRFDTVSVALVRDFPLVSVSLRGAEIISHAFDSLPAGTMPAEADTLAEIGRFDISIDPWSLLKGEVDIRRIGLENTHLHGYVAPNGRANWEIYDTTPDADTTETTLAINIRRVTIDGGCHVVYHSIPDSIHGEIALDRFLLRGIVSSDLAKLDLKQVLLENCRIAAAAGKLSGEGTIDRFAIEGRSQTDYTLAFALTNLRWLDGKPIDSVRMRSDVRFGGPGNREVSVRNLLLAVNELQLKGSADLGLYGDSIATNADLGIDRIRFSRLLESLPPAFLPAAQHYETDLTAQLGIRVEGIYNASTGRLPRVMATCHIPAGYLSYRDSMRRARIDTIALDATAYFTPDKPDSIGVELRTFKVAGLGMHLDARGSLFRLTGNDPRFEGNIRSDLSLDYLTRTYPSKNGITAKGRITTDLSGLIRLSQLTPGRIGNADLHGRVGVDTLRLDLPSQNVKVFIGRGRFGFGSGTTKKDSLIADGTRMVGAAVSLDTLDFDYQDICMSGRDIYFNANTAAKNLAHDTTVVHPSRGVLNAASFRFESLVDSLTFISRGLQTRWSILPASSDPAIPNIDLKMDVRGLSLREPGNRYNLRRGSILLNATLFRQDTAMLARREYRLDSLRQLYPDIPRDSLMAHVRRSRNPKAETVASHADDLDLQLSGGFRDLLSRWQVSGTIRAQSGRVLSTVFPIPARLADIDIRFNTNEIDLDNTFVQAGESQMYLTGRISGLRRAMLGRGLIRGNLTVESDTLNLNELIRVANAGSMLVAQGGVGEVESDSQLEERLAMSADTTGAMSALIVPGNIDMTFDLKVHHGAYANLALDSLSGELIARNRMIRLTDLTMRSDAGNLSLTGLYATPENGPIQTGFDLDMTQMQINRLIELIPSIDTLMPMLRSFEGVVDCQLAATAQLDREMNILLPSLNAACHLEGSNLVLMDGETFAEISKKLFFKNKKHNMIDHISAEFLVRDNQIELFPFVVEIDRYRAAISGVHKLDMTFNYHISVLKSPIPFRLGIDIFGNMDDFDFKITRARYKNANLPTRVALIEDTRLNLRQYISDAFRRGPRVSDIASLRITPETASPTELLPPAEAATAEEIKAAEAAGSEPEGGESHEALPATGTEATEPAVSE